MCKRDPVLDGRRGGLLFALEVELSAARSPLFLPPLRGRCAWRCNRIRIHVYMVEPLPFTRWRARAASCCMRRPGRFNAPGRPPKSGGDAHIIQSSNVVLGRRALRAAGSAWRWCLTTAPRQQGVNKHRKSVCVCVQCSWRASLGTSRKAAGASCARTSTGGPLPLARCARMASSRLRRKGRRPHRFLAGC